MLVKTWLEKEKLNEMMLDELDRLRSKGYKKIKGKWLDEHRRRMFDATGSYIPPYNRISVRKLNLNGLVKSSDHKPKLQQHKEHMRKMNQMKYIERMENQFDKEC